MSKIDIPIESRKRGIPNFFSNFLVPKKFLLIIILLFISYLGALCLNLDYIENRDIIVMKMNASGYEQWQIKLDSTQDDYAQIIHPLNDGGLLIAGNQMINHHTLFCELTDDCGMFDNYPRIIFLNPDGSISKDKIYKELKMGILIASADIGDGNFLFSQMHSDIFNLNTSGNVEGYTEISGNTSGDIEISAFVDIDEVNYFVGGGRDPETKKILGWVGEYYINGDHIWDQLYSNTTRFTHIERGPDDAIILVNGENELIVRDSLRQFVWNITLPENIMEVRMNKGNIEALLPNQQVTLNSEGNIIGTVSFTATGPVTWTDDGGFATVVASGELVRTNEYYTKDCTGITLTKFDPSGQLQWNRTVACKYGGELLRPNWIFGPIHSLVQTKDGGYAVLLYSEKRL